MLVAAMLLGASGSVLAQGVRREFGVEGYTLRATPDRVGGGLYAGWRVGSRERVSIFGGADGGDAGAAARGEALVHFLLAPGKKTGAGAYAAGGLALDIADRAEARLVALVGVEGSPGARQGWMIEAGVGGGWRLAAGWRWRR
ncbi:MAG: hypothetical protein JF590_01215 [Gemmatimonadetes bacterium]|nr:hypothetical protein [Gemmatimonadota bacterium]